MIRPLYRLLAPAALACALWGCQDKPDTVVVDLQGKRVLPGLHDAHVHPVGVIEVEDCNLDNEPVDLAELAAFASACIERLAVPAGEWLVVKQWNFAAGNRPADGLTTLRQALDRASSEHPILLGAGHATLNSVEGMVEEAGQIPARFNSLGITSILDAAYNPELAPLYQTLV